MRYYDEFMNFKPTEFEGAEVDNLRNLLGFQCSEEDCLKLEKDVTKEEIRKVIFKMAGSKAPGPDGYTYEFFKHSWPIVGDDITVAVQSFF